MNSATFPGNAGSPAPGLGPVPPPPPPPPIGGPIPTLRINTNETCCSRRPQPPSDPYEPPAAIQNAMMTKEKKPFTYTPGMGGKLDLSQIRSPRMARRVAKNANDEGIEGPPKSAFEPKAPAPPGSANLFVQPQVAVPVFPSTIPPPPTANRAPNVQISRVPPAVPERYSSGPEQPRMKVETKMTPVTNSSQPNSPETPTSPTQVTLAKAPTPWLQNKTKSQDELPEWARRTNVNKSQETSPESPTSPPIYIQVQQPQQFQNRQPQQQQQQQFQSKPLPQQSSRPQSSPQERTVPLRIEDRPSVFSAKQEPGHHQFQNTQPHHQSRWYQPQSQPQPVRQDPQPVRQDPQQSGGYIIPIMVEGSSRTNGQSAPTPQPTTQPQIRIVPIDNQKMNTQRGPQAVAQQPEPGPIQSKSFRVLQKITSTDADDVDCDQVRRMQLTEDEKILMNKFKEQVDGDTYLHQEADPRYRGSAIPSRAFRYLQNMTDSGDVTTAGAPRAVNSAIKKQNRNSKSFEEMQVNLPASEQTVPEPKKYTGSAIPSRSFRILQAMTTPEAIATQENWQADSVCQTENNVPGNQQATFYPPCPNNFSCPDGGWWTYPISNTTPNQIYTFYNPEDGNTYICYPLFKPNIPPPSHQTDLESEKQSFSISGNSFDKSIDHLEISNNDLKSANNNPNSSNDIKSWNDNLKVSADHLDVEFQEETRIIVTPCTDDETDSESDEESLNSSKSNGKTNSSSSSSDDSESFLAYSTGLNPKTNYQQSLSATTLSEDICERSLSPDKLDSDSDEQSECETCDYKREDQLPLRKDYDQCQLRNTIPRDHDSSVAHRLSVNDEDSAKDETRESNDQNDDANTVNFSLPLRFKSSVSDINQDKTSVTVGDNSLQLENPGSKETEIHVDFTVRRKRQETVTDSRQIHEFECRENVETEFTVGESRTDVIKNIRTEEARFENSQVFYESRVSDVIYDLVTCPECPKAANSDSTFANSDLTSTNSDLTSTNSDLISANSHSISDDTDFTSAKYDSISANSELISANSHSISDDSDLTSVKFDSILANSELTSTNSDLIAVNSHLISADSDLISSNSDSTWKQNEVLREEKTNSLEIDETDPDVDNSSKSKSTNLLSVQNSREETDDEDSGVTSDMSRIISEVDTDSECCTTSRKQSKYQRTQTHSRLFRLLTNDSTTAKDRVPSNRREHLSLPLQSTTVIEDHYCSNYSSGMTSPESPGYEPEKSTRDCYYQTWKSSKGDNDSDILPSMAHKVLDSQKPHWTYRVNVLCPRIRSSRNVPRDLKSSEDCVNPSSLLSFPHNPVRKGQC